MYLLNKIVWGLVNPFLVGFVVLAFAAMLLLLKKWLRLCTCLVALVLVLFWILSMPALTLLTGYRLEAAFPPIPLDRLPNADAIICLGGGVGCATKFGPQVLLNSAADRAYYSAALWKSGKAPIVIPTGAYGEGADAKFMMELGVPRDAIRVEGKARNTEQNAKFIRQLLNEQVNAKGQGHKPRILLVTSAWHMKRSMLMFEKYAPGLEVIAAPTDHECLYGDGRLHWGYLIPEAGYIEPNIRYLHEWAGYWWYKWIR